MNYYEVLEIDPRSSTEEVERAFKRLARKVHPDLNAGDPRKAEARMKQLNEIRDTLTDPLLRAGYDEGLRLDRERNNRAAPPPSASPPAPQPAPARAAPTPSRVRSAAARAPSRAPWFLLVLGVSATSALLWHWRRDLAWSSAAEPAAALPEPTPQDTFEPAPVGPPPPSAGLTADATQPPRLKPRVRGLVRLGSSVDEVLRTFGTPDRIEPGKQSGDAVFVYGKLRLRITNGRVTGGDAAAFR